MDDTIRSEEDLVLNEVTSQGLSGFESFDPGDIQGATSRGIVVSFAAQGGRFLVQFGYSVALARMLTPADFGVVAMAAPVTAFVQLFSDFGLTQATVQRPKISDAELSFMLWMSIAVSSLLGVVTIAAAPLVSLFYNDRRIGPVIALLAVPLALSGFYAQHLALLNRRLQFGRLAIVDLGSLIMGTAVGLCAALLHYSYWAIAIGQVGTTLTALILSWCFARWFPRRYSRVASARELLGFGGNVTVFNTLNYFARNLDNILIGKVSGERALGFYDRAYKLLLFPLSQITTPVGKVATPLLARTISDERRYEKAYFRLLELIVILTYPGVIAVGINSREFVTHILGIQWADAAPIFAVLAVGAVFAPISSSTSWLMTTQGRTKEMRNYGAISSIAFVASFALGLRWGPLGVARCYIAVGAIQGPILWWAVMRRGPVKFITLLRTLLPYIVASVLVILVEVFLRYLPWDTVGFLVFSLVVAYSVFLVGMSITVAGRGALLEVTTQLRSVLKFRAASE